MLEGKEIESDTILQLANDIKIIGKIKTKINSFITGIAKHLCGGATDLAIHSLTQSKHTYGCIIATCWHQRCDLRTYVNVNYLDELGFEKDYEKQYLFKTTSWAVSGAYKGNHYLN